MNSKNTQEKTLENIKRFMMAHNVIIVHQNENIIAKIAKCIEKTK